MERTTWSDLSHLNGSAICLLDDDPSVLKATGRVLLSAGWQVATFTKPQVFLEHVKVNRPRLVVLDILMPLMNGLEVQMRLRDISPATQVIILTSKDDPFVRKTAMKSGATAYFIKGFENEELLALIQRVMS